MRYAFADSILDLDRYELRRGGEPIPVQPKVLALLAFLLERGERTATKSEILAAVWPDTYTSEGSLTRAVSLARSALGESERESRVIVTVRGRGYRIGVPITVESGESRPAVAVAAPVGAIGAPPTRFLCRDKEIELCKEAFDAAFRGHGQILLLVGEPGIGKTRLATEIAELGLQRGARVFFGRCHEAEPGPSYWPWLQILRALLAESGADAIAAGLGSSAPDVAEILLELREQLPDLPRPVAAEPAQTRFRLLEGVTRLLRARAALTPLLLVLDDLHWGDEPSLALLRFLAHELGESRILVVGTYRDIDTSSGHPLQATLAELARTQRPRNRILLRGLTQTCVARFIAALTGREPEPELVAACFQRSEGNPLFLLELLQWLESRDEPLGSGASALELELPEGVRQVIRRRLAVLSEPCRRALEAASALGREFSLGLIARVLELPEAVLLRHLSEAERARTIAAVRGRPGEYRFSHGLVAETLYDALDSAERVNLHARIAPALEQLYTPRAIARSDLELPIPPARLAELARHFSEAAPVLGSEQGMRYAARAGGHAMALLDFGEAVRNFERALRGYEQFEGDDGAFLGGVLLALADAYYSAGQPALCGETLQHSVERARATGDDELLGAVGVRMSNYKIGGNVLTPSAARLGVLEEAERRLRAAETPLRARVLATLGAELYWDDDSRRAETLLEQATALARRIAEPGLLWDVLYAARLQRGSPLRREEQSRIGRELLDLARTNGHRECELKVRIDFTLCEQIELADADGIDRELEQCASLAHDLRQPALRWQVTRAQASRALWRGEFAKAQSLLDEALTLGRQADPDIALLSHQSATLALRRMQGRFSELEAALAREGRLPRARGHKRSALALLYCEQGRHDAAERELAPLAADGFAALRRDSNYSYNLALLAEACAQLEDRGRAARIRELLEPFAGRYLAIQSIVSAGCASRHLGLLSARLGELDRAVSELEEALDVETRMGACPHQAYALRDLARTLSLRGSRGDRASARELRERAEKLAREIGLVLEPERATPS